MAYHKTGQDKLAGLILSIQLDRKICFEGSKRANLHASRKSVNMNH